ncbi:unnamed protein product [Auanema sp. JU1783]|nr:unnamed protein product [Auanema sp. JU1783]
MPCSLKDECDSLLRCESDLARRLVLRPLAPSDLPDVRAICAASFPIKYPDCWYEEVVSGSLISHGLFDGSRLAAIMVSETKKILHCNAEDREILADASSHVVYILSLAVNIEYRRSGLASRLLNHLLDTIIENPPYPRAVFLHVLSTNLAAISFYKTNGFIHHDTLLNYYRLESGYGDGFTFVKYTNGARPPMSFNTLCRMLGEAVCFPVKKLCRFFSYS